MFSRRLFHIAFILILALCASAPAQAQFFLTSGLPGLPVFKSQPASAPAPSQATPTTEPAVTDEAVHDSLGRDTPRGTISGFLGAVAKEDWQGASSYLDLSYLPKAQQRIRGPELATQLQMLLNQGGWIMATTMISDDPLGKQDDALEPNLDRVGALKTGKQNVGLVIERVKSSDDAQIWLIAAQTLKQVPSLIEDIRPPRINGFLPASLIDEKLWSVPVGHWLALGILAALAYLVSWAGTFIIGKIAYRAADRVKFRNIHLFDALELPVRLYIAVWMFIYAGRLMGISALARQHFSLLAVIVGWISLILFLWRLIDIVADQTQQHMSRRGKLGMFSVIAFVRRSAKFIFIAVALMIILGTFGVDVRTGIAALGIGGIALALGAQKTVENFVGSLMLVFDQPVRLGDYCQIGSTQGTVEDIGMRSTRLRTSARTVVTIPNGEFSSQQIENFSRRDRYLFNHTVGLRIETTPEQIRYLLVTLRELLYAHPKVSPEPARVRFVKVERLGFNLEFFAYVITPTYDEFMEVQEDLLLRILEVIAGAGAGLAVPTQLAYTANDLPLSEARTHDAEIQVRQWRDSGELQLPKFSADRIEKIQDSIEYPPKGSSTGKA